MKQLAFDQAAAEPGDSPASNGGRGLKLPDGSMEAIPGGDSPASNGGRGLKPVRGVPLYGAVQIRPPAMAGAD